MTIEITTGFIDELFTLVSQMFSSLGTLEGGILSVLLFAFLVRQIYHWIKLMRYV